MDSSSLLWLGKPLFWLGWWDIYNLQETFPHLTTETSEKIGEPGSSFNGPVFSAASLACHSSATASTSSLDLLLQAQHNYYKDSFH